MNFKNDYGSVNVEQAKNTKFEVFTRILNFLIISKKEIRSKIQGKWERSRKGRYKTRKIKKRIQERNGKREN